MWKGVWTKAWSRVWQGVSETESAAYSVAQVVFVVVLSACFSFTGRGDVPKILTMTLKYITRSRKSSTTKYINRLVCK